MKAIVCENHGLPNTLKFKEIDSPAIGPHDVRIKVMACSVNFPDVLIIQNLYQFKPELPFSPGSEVSGVVLEVGAEVTNVKPNDRVLALCGWGGFAEELAVNSSRVFPIPDKMDYITAASLMYNFGTSYHALKDRANLQAGETLLVLGAGGGVGLAAVELGKLMGATVIAAASTDEKLAVCKEKGADFLIKYDNLKGDLKEITNGKGVDVVYDPIGDKYAEPCVRSMAWKGRYLVVGFAAGEIPKIPLNLALLKGCAITGVFWGQFAAFEPKKNFQNVMQLSEWFLNGKLSPHIHKVYELAETVEALQAMADRKVIGKAVVVTSDEAKVRFEPSSQDVVDPPKKEGNKLIFENFEQIKAFVGQEFGHTEWLTVDQKMINEFAAATLDEQWIHVDTEKAKDSIFGQTIAHGLLTLSLTPKFLEELYEVKNTKMGINMGSDKVRFLNPVLSGSKLRMTGVLKSVSDMPNNGLKMLVEAKIEIEGKSKPACVAELLSIIYR